MSISGLIPKNTFIPISEDTHTPPSGHSTPDCVFCRFRSLSRSLSTPSDSSTPSPRPISHVSFLSEEQKAVKTSSIPNLNSILVDLQSSFKEVPSLLKSNKEPQGLQLIEKLFAKIANGFEVAESTTTPKHMKIQLYLLLSYAYMYQAKLMHNTIMEEENSGNFSYILKKASDSLNKITALRRSRTPLLITRQSASQLQEAISLAQQNLKNLSENLSAEIK